MYSNGCCRQHHSHKKINIASHAPESDANITTAPFRFQVAHRVDQKALPDDDFDNYHDWLSWCCLYDWVLPLLRAVWVLQTLDLALWVHLKPDHGHDDYYDEDDHYYNEPDVNLHVGPCVPPCWPVDTSSNILWCLTVMMIMMIIVITMMMINVSNDNGDDVDDGDEVYLESNALLFLSMKKLMTTMIQMFKWWLQ